jgi:hypothetical protein
VAHLPIALRDGLRLFRFGGRPGGEMRIAVTGTHQVGKTTLIEDLIAANPGYVSVQEAYWELAERGAAFALVPTAADIDQQLDHCLSAILESATTADIVYDRCPLDFIAYHEVIAAAEGGEWAPTGRQLVRIEKALASLELIAFVPIARRDDFLGTIEQPRLRRAVDGQLKSILREDTTGLLAAGPPVVEVAGSRDARSEVLSRRSPVTVLESGPSRPI